MNHPNKYALIVCPNPSIDIYAWVKNFKNGVPNRIIKEKRYPGGKGLHVAMALSEMGIDVIVVGFWGSEAGRWIKKAATQYYPSIKFIGPELAEWSRSCYTFKSNGDFDDTEIMGVGPSISHEAFQSLYKTIDKLLPNAHIQALCGSWPKGSPVNGYQQLVDLAHFYKVNSFLDCTGDQLRHAISSRPYGIHLNRKEITTFYNTQNFEASKNEILKQCTIAAITDGTHGLYYLTGNSALHSLAKIDQVISTIGSGDCLLAGIIAGYILNLTHQEIANLGAACGAANCLREDLGLLYKKDIADLLLKMSS